MRFVPHQHARVVRPEGRTPFPLLVATTRASSRLHLDAHSTRVHRPHHPPLFALPPDHVDDLANHDDDPAPAQHTSQTSRRAILTLLGTATAATPLAATASRSAFQDGAEYVMSSTARSAASIISSPPTAPFPPPSLPASAINLSKGLKALADPYVPTVGCYLPLDERRALQLEGLMPPGSSPRYTEIRRAETTWLRLTGDLDRYELLSSLYNSDRNLWMLLCKSNPGKYLKTLYTPGVASATLSWSTLRPTCRPQGLYLSIDQAGRVKEVLNNWPENDVRIAVVTDGERILGLRDQGAHGMAISIAKAQIYSICASVSPHHVLPITIDVGCDGEVVEDPLYMGLRRRRERGPAYDAFIDEVFTALKERYGQRIMVHFEDFGAQNAFRLLIKYQSRLSCMNDDIQSTGAICLAALLGAERLRDVAAIESHTYLFYGAGQANIGSARLVLRLMMERGLTEDEAKNRIYMMDSQGIISMDRTGLTAEKMEFVRPEWFNFRPSTPLEQVIASIGATTLIGASGKQFAFSPPVIREVNKQALKRLKSRPIVFSLSNPPTAAECTATAAYMNSDFRAVFASGTAFEPIQGIRDKTYVPAQANNAIIYPGIGLAYLNSNVTAIPSEWFYIAAKAVAASVLEKELEVECILPGFNRITQIALDIAASILGGLKEENREKFQQAKTALSKSLYVPL